MRKPCAFTLLLFLLTASNCFAVNFNQIEIYSSNWGETTWLLGTDVMLNEAVSATANYYVNTDGPYPMPGTLWAGSVWLYLDDTTPRYPGKLPTDFNDAIFTWTVADMGKSVYAKGTAQGTRKVPLSTDLTFSGDPYHPTISWSNSDPNLDNYLIRLFDSSGTLLGSWQVPLSTNPSFTFNGVAFEFAKTYKIRIEARDFEPFDLYDASGNPLSSHAQILNRSNAETHYTVGVSFNYVEVYSANDAELGWHLGTNCILNNPFAPAVAYSVAGGGFNSMARVTMPYYQNMYLYNAVLTDRVGGSPSDYNGTSFTWGVDDSANDLSATASISSGIRQVALSTNLAVTGNQVHPTVSWYNPDPDLDYYKVRVTDKSRNILWQSSDLKFSTYGPNPSYTINGFTFEPGME
jgi:hypothetical protein